MIYLFKWPQVPLIAAQNFKTLSFNLLDFFEVKRQTFMLLIVRININNNE